MREIFRKAGLSDKQKEQRHRILMLIVPDPSPRVLSLDLCNAAIPDSYSGTGGKLQRVHTFT
jgi:hypothetical protein